jgi:hypothetical protein
MLRATVIAAVVTALYVANYVNGWVTLESFDFYHPPKISHFGKD